MLDITEQLQLGRELHIPENRSLFSFDMWSILVYNFYFLFITGMGNVNIWLNYVDLLRTSRWKNCDILKVCSKFIWQLDRNLAGKNNLFQNTPASSAFSSNSLSVRAISAAAVPIEGLLQSQHYAAEAKTFIWLYNGSNVFLPYFKHLEMPECQFTCWQWDRNWHLYDQFNQSPMLHFPSHQQNPLSRDIQIYPAPTDHRYYKVTYPLSLMSTHYLFKTLKRRQSPSRHANPESRWFNLKKLSKVNSSSDTALQNPYFHMCHWKSK